MATYPTGWLRLPTDAKDFKERFAWSHVKAIFYDKAKNILLKDKLDAMDKLISDHADAIANKLMTNDAFNTAIADYVTKAMMSSTQVNDANHVPTSSLAYAMQQAIIANANAITKLNSELDSTRNFFVFKTVSQKSITAGTTGFWHEKIKIPVGYKVLYVSATYNNADNCMLTPYDSVIASIGNTSDIEPWFGFYALQTGTGTFTAYAVCVKI